MLFWHFGMTFFTFFFWRILPSLQCLACMKTLLVVAVRVSYFLYHILIHILGSFSLLSMIWLPPWPHCEHFWVYHWLTGECLTPWSFLWVQCIICWINEYLLVIDIEVHQIIEQLIPLIFLCISLLVPKKIWGARIRFYDLSIFLNVCLSIYMYVCIFKPSSIALHPILEKFIFKFWFWISWFYLIFLFIYFIFFQSAWLIVSMENELLHITWGFK